MKLIKEIINSKEFEEKYPMYFHSKEEIFKLIEKVYDYFPDSEEKIAGELKKNFSNFIWVIQLLNLFHSQGRKIIKPQAEGPDIILEIENRRIIIECVQPDNWEKNPPLDGHYSSFHEEEKILRYTSAIKDKSEQYQKWLKKGIISPTDSFLIAISGEKQSLVDVYTECPDIVKAIYPLGRSFYSAPLDNPDNFTVSYERRTEVIKSNQSSIPTDSFLNDSYSYVSGIIFNPYGILLNLDCDGKNYIVINNYAAKNPFPSDLIKGSVYHFVNDNNYVEFKHVD